MSWLPIESAPRDGRTLMLYGEIAGEIGGIFNGSYICIGEPDSRGDYSHFDWVLHNTDAYAAWCKPTHWMPLPSPPESAA